MASTLAYDSSNRQTALDQ